MEKIYTSRQRWDGLVDRLRGIKNPVGAEVGVWCGGMSVMLLQKIPDLFLYMVDRWEPPNSDDSYYDSGSRIARMEKEKFDRAYSMAVSRTAVIAKDRRKILKRMSTDTSGIEDGSLDFCFVDADHSYLGCKNDILAWLPKIKKGGFISGHDFDHVDQGEVKKAVSEIFNLFDVKTDACMTWFYEVKK